MQATKVLVFLVSLYALVICCFGQSDRVLLKDVTALTLHSGKMTTGRRAAPMAQLVCMGGKLKEVTLCLYSLWCRVCWLFQKYS